MFHDIRSLTRGTVHGFYHHHRPAFPRRDVHDTAAPLGRIYQGGSRKSTNLGHYPFVGVQGIEKALNHGLQTAALSARQSNSLFQPIG